MEIQKLNFSYFKKNSLIELVLLPDTNTFDLIGKITKNFEKKVIFDTVGNLYNNYQELQDPLTEVYFISSIEEFIDCADKIKKNQNLLWVIDNITFICDIAPSQIKMICSLLWSIIYGSNVTIVTINTYRIGKIGKKYCLVPRMGDFWAKIISYRVKEYNENGKRLVVIEENSLEDF